MERKDKAFNVLCILIIYLFAHSGLIKWVGLGVDTTWLFGLLSMFLFLFFLYRPFGIQNVEMNVPLVAFMLLHLLILVSASYTVSESYYLTKLSKIFFNLFIFIIPLFVFQSRASFEILAKIIKSCLIIALLLLTYQYFDNQLSVIRFAEEGNARFPDYMSISYFIGTCSLFLFGKKNMTNIVLIVVSLMFMSLLAAKGPIFFFLALLLFLYYKINIARKSSKFLSILIVSIVLVVLVPIAWKLSIFDTLKARIFFLGGSTEVDESTLVRVMLIQKSLEIIAEYPLFGVGIGAFGKMYTGSDQRLSSHNLILEIWTEIGLVGVIVLFVFIISAWNSFRKAKKRYPEDVMATVLPAICFYMLLAGFVASYFEDSRIPYFWLSITIAYFNLLYREQKVNKNVRN